MNVPQAPSSNSGYSETTPLLRLTSMPPELLHALTATQQLHPKQRALLQFLNRNRTPHEPHRTVPLSYTRLHEGTDISIEHIRRNALPRLLKNGLIRVIAQTFTGTIYQLCFNQHMIDDVIRHLQHTIGEPPSLALATSSIPHPAPYDLAGRLNDLDTLRYIHEQRQTFLRDDFAARLSAGQVQWIVERAKHLVDSQDGIRFIKDRFPHYEAARLALLDEWRLRAQYGERIPSTSVPDGAIP